MKNSDDLSNKYCGITIVEDEYVIKSPENEISFSGDIGETLMKKIDFVGVRLLYGKLKFNKPVPVQVVNDSAYVEMYFSLTGRRDIYFTQSNQSSLVAAGYHNLYYIPDNEFFIVPSAGEEENISVQIQFTEEYFKRFMPEGHSLFSIFLNKINAKELSVLSEKHLQITTEMYTLLNDIVHCEKEGIIKQLYIETNVLKLLLLQFEQCESASIVRENNSIKQYDIVKLTGVKRVLEENISYNHSLAELSRKSGLNDFKLKKGFKELFGITVFGYLHELRMAKAKEMLLENIKTTAEIAEYCGYTYVQSFSTAFKQKFGLTPEKYRKQERPPQ